MAGHYKASVRTKKVFMSRVEITWGHKILISNQKFSQRTSKEICVTIQDNCRVRALTQIHSVYVLLLVSTKRLTLRFSIEQVEKVEMSS